LTFNRNEQIAILALTGALLVGTLVSLVDLWWPDAIEDFAVRKGAVPVPGTLASDAPPESGSAVTESSQGMGSADTLTAPHGQETGPAAGVPFPIDLNTASESQLQTLPRVGPATARREANGGFRTVEDLTQVKGIGPRTLETLRPLITVGAR